MALTLSIIAAAVVASAQEPESPDREGELRRLQARYSELQERYLALAEREAEREARTTEMKEAVEKLRAAVNDLVARQAELVASLTALRDRAARIDEAWLRELAVREIHSRDPQALPWESRGDEALYVIACRVAEYDREGETATLVVHEVLRLGDHVVQRRRTLTYAHRDPIWKLQESGSSTLRVDPAPPWIHVLLQPGSTGGWEVRIGEEAGTLKADGSLVDSDRSLLRAIVAERVRAWSEIGIPRADIPAWLVAPHGVPHAAVAAVLSVLEEAGVESTDFVGVPDRSPAPDPPR